MMALSLWEAKMSCNYLFWTYLEHLFSGSCESCPLWTWVFPFSSLFFTSVQSSGTALFPGGGCIGNIEFEWYGVHPKEMVIWGYAKAITPGGLWQSYSRNDGFECQQCTPSLWSKAESFSLCWTSIFICICCCDKCMGCSCLLLPRGQGIWFCNFSCSASGLLHPCSRRELSSKLSRSVCSWSTLVLLAFLMGILRLLSCMFGTHFVFFGASIGSSCLSFGSSSDQCLWLWELLQRKVLSSFMGVQEKQMKQCNICQILSSELLLSDIYSCTCLMLILFCLAWPFFRKIQKKVEFSEIRHLCSATRIICVDICMYDSLLLHQDWVFNTHCLCFLKSPSGESHQMKRSYYGFRS